MVFINSIQGYRLVGHPLAFPRLQLARNNILVSARGEGLRISVNRYSNGRDIQVLIAALNNYKSLF